MSWPYFVFSIFEYLNIFLINSNIHARFIITNAYTLKKT
jgi:hypothetical protein